MIKSTFELEKKLISEGYNAVIGIDEAGRGPLAGPVVACAAAYKFFSSMPSPVSMNTSSHPLPSTGEGDTENFSLIRDSKTLSEKQREALYDFICENFYVGVGMCDHETIDRINILEATYLAMKKAMNDLFRKNPHPALRATLSRKRARGLGGEGKIIILIDGNKKIPNISIEQRAIVNGDKTVKSISAASIVAKVTRDRIMREAHEIYPEYNFAKHKGYGTRVHMEALKKYGPCEIHRKSFGPVRNTLPHPSPLLIKERE